jgi:hypothetical protein
VWRKTTDKKEKYHAAAGERSFLRKSFVEEQR